MFVPRMLCGNCPAVAVINLKKSDAEKMFERGNMFVFTLQNHGDPFINVMVYKRHESLCHWISLTVKNGKIKILEEKVADIKRATKTLELMHEEGVEISYGSCSCETKKHF